MRAYSLDLRQHALDALTAGHSKSEVAGIFGISVRTINRYLHYLVDRESLAAKPIPGRPRAIVPDQDAALTAQLEAQPAATLRQHCRQWEQTQGVRGSPAAMARAIRRLGWTWKKSRWWPPSKMPTNEHGGGTPSPSTTPPSSSSSTSRAPTSP